MAEKAVVLSKVGNEDPNQEDMGEMFDSESIFIFKVYFDLLFLGD